MAVYIEKTNVTDFLYDLAKNVMSEEGVRVMHASGARTPEAVVSLLRNFPTAGQLGEISAPRVSNFTHPILKRPPMGHGLSLRSRAWGARVFVPRVCGRITARSSRATCRR